MAKILVLETISGAYRFELHYASCVMSQSYPSIEGIVPGLASRMSNLGHDVLEIVSPSPDMANQAVNDFNPDAIWFVGHGTSCMFTLENTYLGGNPYFPNAWQYQYGYHPYIEHDLIPFQNLAGCGVFLSKPYGEEEKSITNLKGIIIDALSCVTAQSIGKYLIRHGVSSYHGYHLPFSFFSCMDKYHNLLDCHCEYAFLNSFFESSAYFIYGLSQGMTTKEASDYSTNRFNEWIHYLSYNPIPIEEVKAVAPAFDGTSETWTQIIINVLIQDRDIKTLLGSHEATLNCHYSPGDEATLNCHYSPGDLILPKIYLRTINMDKAKNNGWVHLDSCYNYGGIPVSPNSSDPSIFCNHLLTKYLPDNNYLNIHYFERKSVYPHKYYILDAYLSEIFTINHPEFLQLIQEVKWEGEIETPEVYIDVHKAANNGWVYNPKNTLWKQLDKSTIIYLYLSDSAYGAPWVEGKRGYILDGEIKHFSTEHSTLMEIIDICEYDDELVKGDKNKNCVIDVYDLDALASAWGSSIGNNNYDPVFDFNNDGSIDVYDLDKFAQIWGKWVCE